MTAPFKYDPAARNLAGDGASRVHALRLTISLRCNGGMLLISAVPGMGGAASSGRHCHSSDSSFCGQLRLICVCVLLFGQNCVGCAASQAAVDMSSVWSSMHLVVQNPWIGSLALRVRDGHVHEEPCLGVVLKHPCAWSRPVSSAASASRSSSQTSSES